MIYDDDENNIRPWGRYDVVNTDRFHKIKYINVESYHRTSLQYHEHRSEIWVIISGNGEVEIDGKITEISYGDHCYIPAGAVHRISNTNEKKLIFIEIQVGSYFGEDDIYRIEDDYDRQKL